MSNTILTPTAVTREAQFVLHNNLAFVKNIDRQYDNTYQTTGAKDGDPIKIRLPNKYTVRTGKTIQAQDTTESSVTLNRSTQKGVDMNFSTKELTTDLQDFSKRIISPAVSRLANQLDYDALDMTFDVWNTVGTAGTTPASMQVWLDAMAMLDNNATPRDQNRTAVMNPKAMARTVDGLKSLVEAGDAIADQYRNGVMKRALGLKWAMDQNIRTLTMGTRALGDPIVVNGTLSVEGDTTISIDGGTGSATVVEGEVFTVAGCYAVNPENGQSTGELMRFTVTATNTASGGAWTDIAFSPAVYTTGINQNVNSFPQDGEVVTFYGTASLNYPFNLVFHEDAFAFATIDLELPEGVHFKGRETKDGISIRIVRQYDINNDNIPARLDVLYGYVTKRGELACRVIG